MVKLFKIIIGIIAWCFILPFAFIRGMVSGGIDSAVMAYESFIGIFD